MTDQPQIDLAWSDPELDAALFAIDSGDPAPALALVRRTVGDADRRELVVGVLGDALAQRRELVGVVGGEGADDPDRLVLWASALLSAAFEARGGDVVERTSQAQFASMSDLLRQTRGAVARVLAARPDDTAAHLLLVLASRAETYEPDEVQRVWEGREAAGPLTLETAIVRVTTLSPRWHGGPGDSIAYARSVVADLPDGDPLLATIAQAHVEEWVERGFWRSLAFAFRPRWRPEVDAASDRLLAGPEGGTGVHAMRAHQVFACLYSLVEDEDRLRRHLALGGSRPALYPWAFVDGDPAGRFHRERSKAGLA